MAVTNDYNADSIKILSDLEHIRQRSGMYIGDNGYNWTKLPLIPFKYNPKEIPLIRDVKPLQDALNEVDFCSDCIRYLMDNDISYKEAAIKYKK